MMAEKIPAPIPSEEELEKEQKFRGEKIKIQAEIEKPIIELRQKISETPPGVERSNLERQLREKLQAAAQAIGSREELEEQVRETIAAEERKKEREEAARLLDLPQTASWQEIYKKRGEQMEHEERIRKEKAKFHGLPESASWEEINIAVEERRKEEEERLAKLQVEHEEPIKISKMLEPEAPKPAPKMAEEKAPVEKKGEFEKLEVTESRPDIGTIMADENFSDFLVEYAGDNVENLDRTAIEQFYEAYQASQEVKDFYQDTVEKDSGAKLEKSDFKALDVYFINQKDLDSKFAQNTRDFLEEFKSLPAQIDAKEKEFTALGGDEALSREQARLVTNSLLAPRKGMELGRASKQLELRKELAELKFFDIKKWFLEMGIKGIVTSKEEEEIYKKSVEQYRNETALLNSDINKIAAESEQARVLVEKLAKLKEEKNNLRERYDARRQFFFEGDFGPAKPALEAAKEGLRRSVKELADPESKSEAELIGGLELAKKLSEAKIVKLGDEEIKMFEKWFDDALEYKISDEIVQKLKEFPVTKATLAKDIENLVNGYLKKEKIGKKTKPEEIEEVVVKSLQNFLKKKKPIEGETPENFKAKKTAVKLLILKLGFAE